MKCAAPVALLAMALVIAAAGCGDHPVFVNQPPEVTLESTPFPIGRAGTAAFRLRWTGHDPEGRVDHYVYAVDPRSVGTVDEGWTRTDGTTFVLMYPVAPHDTRLAAQPPRVRHVFAVRAVDAPGAMSAPASETFADDNIVPRVRISCPRACEICPSDGRRSEVVVPGAMRVRWQGSDRDGPGRRPAKYKFILIPQGDPAFDIEAARDDPDSLRRRFAPEFAGWDSVASDTTDHLFRGLAPYRTYLFAIVAIDAAGDYSADFSFESNLLFARSTLASVGAPALAVSGDGFFYEYPGGGIAPAPVVTVETAAALPVTIHWYATAMPSECGEIRFRWALDIADLDDETPRTDEATDWAHWSRWSATLTSAMVGPFATPMGGSESHRFYVEAEDDLGLLSLGVVGLSVVGLRLEREMLIVDDTRLPVDQRSAGGSSCMNPPKGLWPTAAELDTFLYARGGVPWRCYPAGTLSPPGIFNGYVFDTLGTRGLPGVVPSLATLARYRRVIWLTDGKGALESGAPGDPTHPTTALRWMSRPGGFDVLRAYVRQGGQVWLAGGGAALATLIDWDRHDNDYPPVGSFTFSSFYGELVPGRFMYDLAHWRSEIRVVHQPVAIHRSLGRFEARPGIYATLPSALLAKTPATDPYPPNRGQVTGEFYQQASDVEVLSQSNTILEDGAATLDTLYWAISLALPPGQLNAAMTFYHGAENAPLIFTGFNLWSFRRSQCAQLVDFVLQKLWSMPPPAPALSQHAARD